jgi:hypothetical protein
MSLRRTTSTFSGGYIKRPHEPLRPVEVDVEILSFRSKESNTLIGFGDFQLTLSDESTITFYDCPIHERSEADRWINLPSVEYKDKEGKKTYKPLIKLDPSLKAAFDREAFNQLELHVNQSSSQRGSR